MAMLEHDLNADAYGWAKERQRHFLRGSAVGVVTTSHACSANYVTFPTDGGRGKLAGAALSAYGWTQNRGFEDNTGNAAESMRKHWIAASRLDLNRWGLYFMSSVKRAIHAFDPPLGVSEDGRDWQDEMALFLLNKQDDQGVVTWCSNDETEEDGACEWILRRRISDLAGTAMAVQIMQSWSSVRAIADVQHAAVPPGVPVRFSHTPQSSLKSGSSLSRFRWNVVDDEADDSDDDGVVDTKEIRWDFEAIRAGGSFEFAYEDELDWDERKVHPITLAVIDAQGQVSYDSRFSVTVSYDNHAPNVIPHPGGEGSVYRAAPGEVINLDGSASYDVDAAPLNDRVFPGDGNAPAGMADRITSICMDLDRDGQWCEAGEDATASPIEYTVSANAFPRAIIAIPMRVCDDGRWNGACYEAGDNAPADVTRDDCSRCGYGQALIQVR